MVLAYAKPENEGKILKTAVALAKAKFLQIKNKNAVRVPGVGQMHFAADQENQIVKLHNPGRNSCYFRISMVLSDGAVIWTSDLIAPGERITNITLNRKLSEGIYDNVTIKYDCFAMNKKVSFNNARIKVKLIVRKNRGDRNEKNV